MKEVGGVFLQAESEIAAINMVYGAAATGARAMTSSSGPGISLKQEGLSFLAGAELPAVIVNVMRGGPGLGNIAPSQSDYFQATRGGGHGDYHLIVLAPNSVQEMLDLAYLAFGLADKYRNPVMILADAILGQMMEGVEFKEENKGVKKKDWIIGGDKGRKPNIIPTIPTGPANWAGTLPMIIPPRAVRISLVMKNVLSTPLAKAIRGLYRTKTVEGEMPIIFLFSWGSKIGFT
ncbi:unnamed protein product [marine sediment metagenome]|uniref:Pyruvate flavodoxin/ferredoxin oxidoreductase pyrimidine binding domain-containing protein n=1 Tax=marine sediment metagenome TaxID=412755 RepID=X1EXS3_9ZZZZ